RLEYGDPRELPSVEDGAGQPGWSTRHREAGAVGPVGMSPALPGVHELLARQTVDVAYVEQMPLIEVGTRSIRVQIVGVNQRCVGSIGGIVERMAVRVRRANG